MEAEWTPIPGDEKFMINRHAVPSYVAMREAAAAEGVELIILSAHRTRATAERNAARANNPSAVASFSSHSLGLAIDFQMSQGDRKFAEVTTRPMSDVVRMRESPVHKWMFLRGEDFGWFPFQHEPWHWEYNPVGFREVFWSTFPGGMPPVPPPAD
jgi:LAS superfamily LD-carboxypeptidase LdcB